MYCSTCGSHIPAGRAECTSCGASAYPVARTEAPQRPAPAPHSAPSAQPAPMHAHLPALGGAHACPRCGYRGEGVGYFSKGSHVAGLILLGLLSAGFMGLFALIYYFSFHEHRVCPRCGKDWGKRGVMGHAGQLPAPAGQGAALPGGGSAKQGWAVALFVVAVVLLATGIGALEAAPVLMGIGAGVGGAMLHNAARREREARRQALLSSLQLPVLQLAAQRQGRLTVTEVAAALGWSLPRAEKVLESLEDGLRVSSDVTDEGVIVYEFRELAHSSGRQLPGTF